MTVSIRSSTLCLFRGQLLGERFENLRIVGASRRRAAACRQCALFCSAVPFWLTAWGGGFSLPTDCIGYQSIWISGMKACLYINVKVHLKREIPHLHFAHFAENVSSLELNLLTFGFFIHSWDQHPLFRPARMETWKLGGHTHFSPLFSAKLYDVCVPREYIFNWIYRKTVNRYKKVTNCGSLNLYPLFYVKRDSCHPK